MRGAGIAWPDLARLASDVTAVAQMQKQIQETWDACWEAEWRTEGAITEDGTEAERGRLTAAAAIQQWERLQDMITTAAQTAWDDLRARQDSESDTDSEASEEEEGNQSKRRGLKTLKGTI
jgi:hypothetical protein